MVLTDAQWVLELLIQTCRPRAKVPPSDLRRTLEAIIWRCTDGAKWRSILAELEPGKRLICATKVVTQRHSAVGIFINQAQ